MLLKSGHLVGGFFPALIVYVVEANFIQEQQSYTEKWQHTFNSNEFEPADESKNSFVLVCSGGDVDTRFTEAKEASLFWVRGKSMNSKIKSIYVLTIYGLHTTTVCSGWNIWMCLPAMK